MLSHTEGYLRTLSLFSVLGASVAVALGCATKTTVVDPPSQPPSQDAIFNGLAFQAQTPPPPISGGTLLTLVTQDGASLALASDPEEDVVHVVSLDQNKELGRVALQAGDDPGRLVADGAGRVHVVLRRGGAIATLTVTKDGASLAQRRSVCSAPRGIDWDPSSDSLWVACATGEVEQLAAAGGAPVFSTTLDQDLRDVVVSGNSLYITRFRAATIVQFDTTKLVQVSSYTPALPMNLDSAAAPDVAWRLRKLSNGTLRVLFQVASTAPIDLTTPPGVSSYGGGSVDQPEQNGQAGGVVHAAVASVGQTASTVSLSSNQVVDMASNDANGFETISVQGVIDNGGAQFALPFDDGSTSGQPDTYVAIARLGSKLVAQRRGASPELVVVNASLSQNLGNAGVLAEVPLQQNVSHVDTGFDVFHQPTSAGIACMNCHPEGGDDGHTWMFQLTDGNRERRTQSLRGGIITDSAPYHWDGDMTNLQVLCDEVFSHRMGGAALLPDSQTPLLARFVNAMPRVPVSNSLDQTKIAAGKTVFEGAGGCNACHQGGRGTLSQNQSIGKVDSIGSSPSLQVPILLGVAQRAPYMHDGCAPTLMDRLTDQQCAGSAHGNVGALSADDKTNLVEYLQSL
jgi:mono/diheme cytochrome c family protein